MPKLIYTVILWYRFVVQSPPAPPQGGDRHFMTVPLPLGGTGLTKGGEVAHPHHGLEPPLQHLCTHCEADASTSTAEAQDRAESKQSQKQGHWYIAIWFFDVPPPPCISYALVQATVGVGTVLIWDIGVAYTRGGG